MLLLKPILSLLLLSVPLVNAKRIKFYDSLNFTGLFAEYSGIRKDCVEMPDFGQGKLVSVISDDCIILHQSTKCPYRGLSLKLAPGRHDDIKNRFGIYYNAFEVCNVNDGGETLNVKLYYGFDLNSYAVQYYGVCGCINTPSYISTVKINSVNNNGNCVKLFGGTDCTGKSIELHGGNSIQSKSLSSFFDVPTRSISSCEEKLGCLKLEAIISKIELTTNISRDNMLERSIDIELAAKTTFRNVGNSVVTQQYQVASKITEYIEINRSNSLREMSRVRTDKDTELGFSADLSFGPFPLSEAFKNRLFEGFTMDRNVSYQEKEKYFSNYEREFSVGQNIQIAPCTLFKVSSVVRYVKRVAVNYVVLARISGLYDGLRLAAYNLKDRLTGMEYMGKDDDYTVIGKVTGSMFVDFGVETVIDGESIVINGCKV